MSPHLPTQGERLDEKFTIRLNFVRGLYSLRAFDLFVEEAHKGWPLLDQLDKWFPGQSHRTNTRNEVNLWLAEALWNVGKRKEAQTTFASVKSQFQRLEKLEEQKQSSREISELFNHVESVIMASAD